jgi:sugar O-acyltransferase (sialic acid O-acetyltransferase NeuD family)
MTKENNHLVVIGAGDHAKVVIATIEAQAKYKVIGLLDDDESKHGTTWFGHQVLGGDDQLARLKEQGVSKAVIAVGENVSRAKLAQLAVDDGFELPTVIHPTAVILKGSVIGDGSVILPNAYVGADARIGSGALLSVGAMVAHDCILGDWCQLCPGARLGGHVRIGDYSLIGMGASVLPGVTVGRRAVVGANAAVIEDVSDFVTAVGVPARATPGPQHSRPAIKN